jgi:2-methylcitrate dehydratase PrpD
MEAIKIPGTPTLDLATFASGLRFSDISKEAIEHAKTCILDNLGCVLSSKNLPWCEKLYEFIREEKGRSIATCWGRPERVSATQAALYNGTAGHGFEIDDLYITSHHPGSVTIPAAMAARSFLQQSWLATRFRLGSVLRCTPTSSAATIRRGRLALFPPLLPPEEF